MAGRQILISTTQSSEENTICVRDALSNNIITSYKTSDRSVVGARCLQVISDCYLVSTYTNSTVLNVWSLAQKDSIHRKIILPKSNPTALIVSSDSNFIIIALGSKIYIWDLKNGRLLNILECHYGTVTHLAMTDDCSRLISAGDDSMINIYDFPAMLIPADDFKIVQGISSRHKPMISTSLPYGQIMDLHLTPGSTCTSGLICIAFSKGFVAIFNTTGQQLSTLVLSRNGELSARSVTMDRARTRIFIGLENGDILESLLSTWGNGDDAKKAPQMLLLDAEPSEADKAEPKSPQKSNTSGLRRPEKDFSALGLDLDKKDSPPRNVLKGHSMAVTCLAIRWDGHVLVSGSFDKRIMIWDVRSRQCTKTLNHQGAISNLILTCSLSGLNMYSSLDSQLNLEMASSNVSNDISFASNSSDKQKTSKSVRTGDSGSLMKLPTNPPSTIATEFQRTNNMDNPFNFEAKQYSTINHGSVGPQTYGTLIVENASKDFDVDMSDFRPILIGESICVGEKDGQASEFKKKRMDATSAEEAETLSVKELLGIDVHMETDFAKEIIVELDY